MEGLAVACALQQPLTKLRQCVRTNAKYINARSATRANRADLPRRGRSAWRQGTGGRAAIRRPSASDDGRADPGDAPEYWRGAASNTSDCSPHASVAAPRSMPIRRTGPGCCARVASGQAAAAPPTSVMNSRRCPVPLVLPTERITHLNYGRRLLRCGISFWPMTAAGQSLLSHDGLKVL